MITNLEASETHRMILGKGNAIFHPSTHHILVLRRNRRLRQLHEATSSLNLLSKARPKVVEWLL